MVQLACSTGPGSCLAGFMGTTVTFRPQSEPLVRVDRAGKYIARSTATALDFLCLYLFHLADAL
jgi:hypothetical protein